MSELLEAAKAVIERWDVHHVVVDGVLIADLCAAVEQAENRPDAIQIWYRKHWEAMEHKSRAWLSWEIWQAAQHAERERVKSVIKAIGVQGNSDAWFDVCDRIMEKIDEVQC